MDRDILDCALRGLGLLAWLRKAYFAFHGRVKLRFKLATRLGADWTRDGGTPQRVPSQYGIVSTSMSLGVDFWRVSRRSHLKLIISRAPLVLHIPF